MYSYLQLLIVVVSLTLCATPLMKNGNIMYDVDISCVSRTLTI